jgi:RNA polymerase sigma-70 factor (ECF subfamily)
VTESADRLTAANDFAQRLVALLPALGRYARSLTSDTDAAADLVQGVALRALERRGQCGALSDPEAWLITMTRNLYRTGERTRLTRLRNNAELRVWGNTGRRLADADIDVEDPTLIEEASTCPDQLDRLALGDVDRALATLPRRQRETVLLVALTGLRGAGLARAAGTSHQAAWHRLTRGRERLRRLCA